MDRSPEVNHGHKSYKWKELPGLVACTRTPTKASLPSTSKNKRGTRVLAVRAESRECYLYTSKGRGVRVLYLTHSTPMPLLPKKYDVPLSSASPPRCPSSLEVRPGSPSCTSCPVARCDTSQGGRLYAGRRCTGTECSPLCSGVCDCVCVWAWWARGIKTKKTHTFVKRRARKCKPTIFSVDRHQGRQER